MAKSSPDSPTQIVELSQACVQYVQKSLQLELDYTQDTLPILDHYLREASADAKPEISALLAPTAGAYFGELVRRVMPTARWHAPQQDYARYRLEFGDFFLHFNPIGLAREVIDGADAPGWNGHFAMLDNTRRVVESTLASDLSVRNADYYSLSVRYETLESVADALEALAHQAKGPRATFGADVYESAMGNANGN